jgi:hypothetical protein
LRESQPAKALYWMRLIHAQVGDLRPDAGIGNIIDNDAIHLASDETRVCRPVAAQIRSQVMGLGLDDLAQRPTLALVTLAQCDQ